MHPDSAPTAVSQSASSPYRRGHVYGVLLLMLTLPLLTYYLWICLTDFYGALIVPTSQDEFIQLLVRLPAPTVTSVALYGGWFLLQVVLQIVAPGKVQAGTSLADGSRLTYRMNGWFAFWCTLALLFLAVATGWLSPTAGYDP